MPDAELLVYRALDRPPREGELYCYPHAPTQDSVNRIYRREKCVAMNSGMRAVVPVEDYIAGAEERVNAVVAKHFGDECPLDEITAALTPPPPEPDVPEWVDACAKAWVNGPRDIDPDDMAHNNLARHIAKHARAAEGE